MTAALDYRDPLEAALSAQVSDKTLMEHVRTIGALERESGSPGEAQAFDYIERMLKSYGIEVERREIEAYISLPLEGRLHLPDGGTIEGLTHAFSTSVEALEGELVDVGDGRPADYARANAAGKIALVNGLPAPGRAWAAQQAGTLGQIFVLMDHLHNMIVTTIWGTPSPETAWRIPAVPCLSVLGVEGQHLRALLARGPVNVRMTTRLRTGWMPIPHLIGELVGRHEDRFLLFSGHVDSWHYGAMDNGTANATMLEVARLLAGRRFSRAGDQSFWGAGVPSAFMSLSGLPKQDTDLSRAMERLVGSAGFPWWWHTKDDTIDKIDPDVLALDTKVYLASALRWLNAPVLPLDHGRAVRGLLAELEALQAAAGARFDLAPAVDAARALVDRLDRAGGVLAGVDAGTPAAKLDAINRGLMRLSRVLVPLSYTSGDPFIHDLALPIPPLAGLQRVRELAALDPDTDAFKFARAALVRERNRAVHAFDTAASAADDLLRQ